MSLTVMSPMQRLSSSTTSTFSMRWRCSSRLASSRPTPSRTVTRFSEVISSLTGWLRSVANLTSRWVRMPASLSVPGSTTGTPETPLAAIRSSAARSGSSGPMVSGFTIMPDSNFLTRRTSAACRSMDMFLWITPSPPFCAMATAMGASVTVSIAAESSGMPRSIVAVRRGRRADGGGENPRVGGDQGNVVEGQGFPDHLPPPGFLEGARFPITKAGGVQAPRRAGPCKTAARRPERKGRPRRPPLVMIERSDRRIRNRP